MIKRRCRRISEIRKSFKNEWVLIGVTKVDDSQPVQGWVIDHSPNRTTIYKEIGKYSAKHPVMVVYSQDNLPKGYAAAFRIYG